MESGLTTERSNLSVAEAARRLGVSPHTLRAWARYQHRIAYIRAGRRILFAPADLAAFEARCRVEARE
jgi:excisionase family DNA binding protein